ncbi:hypothetical protein HPB51_002752 [Rhipicephalus microplus]|uniref:Uncharacterized protein n=1 Tax=Rhipicephalus microplus TaxID=6941 RepID=A0A9J6EWP0_RHIMP|nr:hypothetical protein HPB51_002752 [Rhipicephalus microplus]
MPSNACASTARLSRRARPRPDKTRKKEDDEDPSLRISAGTRGHGDGRCLNDRVHTSACACSSAAATVASNHSCFGRARRFQEKRLSPGGQQPASESGFPWNSEAEVLGADAVAAQCFLSRPTLHLVAAQSFLIFRAHLPSYIEKTFPGLSSQARDAVGDFPPFLSRRTRGSFLLVLPFPTPHLSFSSPTRHCAVLPKGLQKLGAFFLFFKNYHHLFISQPATFDSSQQVWKL